MDEGCPVVVLMVEMEGNEIHTLWVEIHILWVEIHILWADSVGAEGNRERGGSEEYRSNSEEQGKRRACSMRVQS